MTERYNEKNYSNEIPYIILEIEHQFIDLKDNFNIINYLNLK